MRNVRRKREDTGMGMMNDEGVLKSSGMMLCFLEKKLTEGKRDRKGERRGEDILFQLHHLHARHKSLSRRDQASAPSFSL